MLCQSVWFQAREVDMVNIAKTVSERRRGKERKEIFVMFNVVLVIDIIRLKQEISQKTATFGVDLSFCIFGNSLTLCRS